MNRFRTLLSASAVVVLASPAVLAQNNQSLDQYPSFVEFTTMAQDGTTTVLRCGYSSSNGKTVELDPSFAEISTVNSIHGAYARLQHIDDYVIATTAAPAGSLGLHLELIGPHGPPIAKTCQTDTQDDSISNCLPSAVNEPATQILSDDRTLGSQCVGLMQQSLAKIDASLASPEKSQAWKAGLHQKIFTLQAKQQ